MKKICIFIVAIFVISNAYAGTYAGLPGTFLNWGAGARSLGMGKAFVGLAEDSTSTYWNPAGLSYLLTEEITGLHAFLFESTNYDFISYAQPLKNLGGIGLGVVILSSTGFEEINQYGEIIGSFYDLEAAVLLSYGMNILKDLSLGSTFKVVYQQILSYEGVGAGVDIGFLYKPFEFLNLGGNIQNIIAPRIKLKDEMDTYPLNFRFGVALKLLDSNLSLTNDIEKTLTSAFKFHVGLEYWLYPFIGIRGGLDETEVTAGIGLSYKGYGLDYAIASQSLGLSHRVSFTWVFSVFTVEVETNPKMFSPVGTKKEVEIKLKGGSKFGIRRWELSIKDKTGTKVRRFEGKKQQPPSSIIWNGKDDNGSYVPDGKYSVELLLENKLGEVDTGSDSVQIETSLPGTTIQMEIK
ncbi:MAG: PorV/PorQ family protein [Candidatus Firestonebacteria bacterium]